MGKLEMSPVIEHFSHHHPLHLQNNQSQHFLSLNCAACKRQASGLIYYCETCNYCLHKTCSSLPESYSHKVDSRHALALLSSPAYPEGAFRCNACGSNGTGFCYHCPECQIDLHPVCAFMPLTTKNRAHEHELGLCFSPPYDDRGFSCDICNGSGSNHWLYRCDLCEFDVHMKCAKTSTQVQAQAKTRGLRAISGSQPQLVMSRSVHNQQFSQPPLPPPAAVPQYSIPGGGFTNGSLPFGQAGTYVNGATHVVAPGYVQQPQRSNSGLNFVAGRIIDGMLTQVGQSLIEVVLDGDS